MTRLAIISVLALASCDTAEQKQSSVQSSCVVDWPVYDDLKNELNPLNAVTVQRSNAITWNGVRVSTGQLSSFMRILPTMDPEPLTLLRFERSSTCAQRASAIKLMKTFKHCASRCMFDGIVEDSELEPEVLEL